MTATAASLALQTSAGFSLSTPRPQGSMLLSPERPPQQRSARSVLTGNSQSQMLEQKRLANMAAMFQEFTSDVGRRKFGFSHEELDDAKAYYEGQFKLGMRWGDGTLHNPDTGAKYVGQFQNDKLHGHGDQEWPDGSRYVGLWRGGQKHGQGTFTSSDQLNYVGQWENGRRHGQGSQEYANRDRYEGWWFHGMCSGLGTYYFADGSRFEGAWANGRYDGTGTLFSADGTRERMTYNNGLLMKREVLASGGTASVTSPSRRNHLQHRGNAVVDQAREDMIKPTVLSKPIISKHLIRRETDGLDLSAPPLKPRTAPAATTTKLQDSLDLGEPDPRMQATWPQFGRYRQP